MGISDRHLRRVIKSEFGVSPIQLVQTQRLLLAKRLLTDTNLSVTEVAFASSFSSLRRFNTLFKERYRLNPTDLRQARTREILQTFFCELAYRPPFDWKALLNFLVIKRAVPGVETAEGDGRCANRRRHRYLRTVAWKHHRGWITVEPLLLKHVLRVELSASLAPAMLPTLAPVKRLFDLAAEPQQIAAHLGSLAAANPGLRVPGAFDSFEMAVRAILGQQVSVKAAATLAGRFVAKFGEPIETPFARLTHLPPTAERIAIAAPEELIALGIISRRANSILALAKAIALGELVLEPKANCQETIAQLKKLPGIGEWTAQYIAMRALSCPDAFPHTDLGIYKALNENNPLRVLQLAEAWRPWRSYAAMHLWKSLEL